MKLSASRLVVIGVSVVVVLALVIVLTRRSDSTSAATPTAANGANDSSPPGASTDSSSPPPSVVGQQPGQSASAAAAGLPAPPVDLPVRLTVSNTEGLRDGETVTIHAQADSGSSVYALEARLCAGDSPATYDADLYPTVTGNCIVNPLSATSDDHLVVAGAAPYQAVDLNFRVGVGSDSFKKQDGSNASITCGPDNPCQISLKVQIPNGFGFRTYPLTFA